MAALGGWRSGPWRVPSQSVLVEVLEVVCGHAPRVAVDSISSVVGDCK